jgi:hypothetical protein
MMKTHDPVAELPLTDSISAANDSSGNLMPKDLRRRDESMLDFLDVCAANATCGDADEHFTSANLRHRNVFDDYTPFAPIDSRAHRGRN